MLTERFLSLRSCVCVCVLSGNFYSVNSGEEIFLFILLGETLPKEVKCKNCMHLCVCCFATD